MAASIGGLFHSELAARGSRRATFSPGDNGLAHHARHVPSNEHQARSTKHSALARPSWYAECVRFLGVDYGRKRIGLAVSDATGLLARPWKTITATGGIESAVSGIASEIESLRREPDGLDGIILGFPRRLSGLPNEQTPFVEAIAARLLTLISDLPVYLQDERLSSHEADALLARREKDWKKRKPLLDAAAAAVILQDYLDSRK